MDFSGLPIDTHTQLRRNRFANSIFRIPNSLFAAISLSINEFDKYLQSSTQNSWERGIRNSVDSLLPLSHICYASRALPAPSIPLRL